MISVARILVVLMGHIVVVINLYALSHATEAYNYSTVTRRIFIDTLVVHTYY